jgi:hypothetical protein
LEHPLKKFLGPEMIPFDDLINVNKLILKPLGTPTNNRIFLKIEYEIKCMKLFLTIKIDVDIDGCPARKVMFVAPYFCKE